MNELIVQLSETPIAPLVSAIQKTTREVAEKNAEILLEGERVPATTRYAVVVIEQLKNLNGVDLVTLLERGRLIREIINKNLLAVHPGGYTTLEEMARDQGISVTELSQTRDLCEIIFPYLAEHGFNIYELWEKIGKSKFKEMTPVLKALITGQPSATRSVNEAVQNLLDEQRELRPDATEEEWREGAIDLLIEHGQLLTNQQLREQMRPPRREPIMLRAFTRNGDDDEYYIVSKLSKEDIVSLANRLGTNGRVLVFRNNQLVEFVESRTNGYILGEFVVEL